VNAYAVIILAALGAELAIDVVTDLLNLRALRPEAPSELADVYDADRYRRSQEYTRARTRFGLIPATASLVVLLAFWFAGGFGWLDEQLRQIGLPPIVTGLLFLGALGLAQMLISLPFRWYSTFVIEERFGFNRTTPLTFVTDTIKGLAVAVVVGAPLLAAILWLFEAAGPSAWLWCWAVTTGLIVLLQFVAPTWIFPLFNRFEPLPEGQLREAMLAYAEKVSFPIEGLFVIDGSRRSTKANAFFTGFGRRKRVALFDTLIQRHEPNELLAIFAHEVGHYKKGHVLMGLAIAIAQYGVLFFALSLFIDQPGLFEAFSVDEPSVYAGLLFVGLLFSPIDLALSLPIHALSRRNEFQADAYARQTTGLADELVSGLKRLSADNLANLTPHPLYVKRHYSHPPLIDRVRALHQPSESKSIH